MGKLKDFLIDTNYPYSLDVEQGEPARTWEDFVADRMDWRLATTQHLNQFINEVIMEENGYTDYAQSEGQPEYDEDCARMVEEILQRYGERYE